MASAYFAAHSVISTLTFAGGFAFAFLRGWRTAEVFLFVLGGLFPPLLVFLLINLHSDWTHLIM